MVGFVFAKQDLQLRLNPRKCSKTSQALDETVLVGVRRERF
jgi:hypothetical protein